MGVTGEMNEATQAIAREAGREGARDVLRSLGIDPTDADEVRHFQANMAWVFRFRRMSERVGITIIVTVVGIVTGGIVGLVWNGIRSGAPKLP